MFFYFLSSYILYPSRLSGILLMAVVPRLHSPSFLCSALQERESGRETERERDRESQRARDLQATPPQVLNQLASSWIQLAGRTAEAWRGWEGRQKPSYFSLSSPAAAGTSQSHIWLISIIGNQFPPINSLCFKYSGCLTEIPSL